MKTKKDIIIEAAYDLYRKSVFERSRKWQAKNPTKRGHIRAMSFDKFKDAAYKDREFDRWLNEAEDTYMKEVTSRLHKEL